jgi:two-component system, OmpR family, sensor histidine kinase VicK
MFDRELDDKDGHSEDNTSDYKRTPLSPTDKPNELDEKTEVIYGTEKTTCMILKVLSNTSLKWDNYTNSQGPSIGMGVDPIRKGFKEAYKRGVKIRFITEISNNNLQYCQEFMKIAELRHIDNAKGGMAVTEKEYIATANLQEAQPVAHLIYSNVREIIEQQQEVFESLWDKAIPAELRIREIKEGYQRVSTKVIDNWNEIYENINSLAENSDEVLICSDISMLKLAYRSLFIVYQKMMDRYDKKHHEGIRWIVSVNGKEDVELLRLFMDMGIKIRSIKNLPIINYLVTDKIFLSNIEGNHTSEYNKLITSMLVSNDPSYIRYYKAIFEDLWKNGIDVGDLINDIDLGYDPERIDIISRSNNVLDLYHTIVQSSKKEIMVIFPSTGAFIRQHKVGLISSMFETVKINGVKLKALFPSDHRISRIIEELKLEKNFDESKLTNIEFRDIESFLETRSTILIVDKKISLVMELRDDSKDSFYDAIGLSTYSNSKAGVLSYVLFFENLWNQTEISMNLKKANEKLRESESLQNDFIHIAAHELKNPLQPILMMSEVMKSILNQMALDEPGGEVRVNPAHLNELLDIIIRNTNKLSKLTNNVLDITKIESNSLILDKEPIDMRKFLYDSIVDFNNPLLINGKKYTSDPKTSENIENEIVKLIFHEDEVIESNENASLPTQKFVVEIDKSRILQVLTNLIDNAIKFTSLNEQIIVKLNKYRFNNLDFAKVTIKDTGTGIDPDILPKLFSKFITKSVKGTGLGLYICKNIVSAHGGQIWAQNNDGERGATFVFTIPIYTASSLNEKIF